MNGEMVFLVKLCLAHLLQKNGPKMHGFQCDLEWRNGLVMKCNGLVIMENGPVMSVPVICDGLQKCCCLLSFTSRLALVSVTSLGCS